MAKRKVSGPVKASKGGNSKTNTEPQVKKKEQAKQKVKTRSKVKEGLKSSVQDEELARTPEVIQNGRRRGRSAKLQAVKKMATMQEDIKGTEGSDEDDDDEDDVSLDLECDDEEDEDEDDFEATLPVEKRTSNTRHKPLSSGKLKSQGKSKQLPKEDLKAQVKQVEMKYEERYVSQASQEQFLSLSESDSSSEDEDIGSSSKLKGSSSKPIPDKSKSVNAAADKSKLMETKKELSGSSPVVPSHSALKSMFDDIEDVPDLEGSQPGKDGRCTQSLFDDVDQESDHGDLRTHEEQTDAKPVVASQYFANSDGDECRSPDRKNLTLKEKLYVNDARSPVQSTLSDQIEQKEDDKSEFEESPPKKAKTQIGKRPTKGKQAAKIKENKNEKPTKRDDDPNASPATSQYFANSDADECKSPDRKNLTLKEKLNVNDARSTVKSTLFDEIKKKEDDESEIEESPSKKQIRKRPTKGKQAAKIKEQKNEKQTKKDDDHNALPATSQYFANKDADECRSPDRKNLTLTEKLNVNDARSTVKSTLSDDIKNKEDDESEVEESLPKNAKKQIGKRPTTGKQAAKIEDKKNEKQTKKDDDPKRPTTGKQATKIEEKKSEKQTKKNDDPKRPTTGKQATKIEEKKSEKQTKKDDDPKRPTTGKQATKIKEKKNEKQTKKDDDPKRPTTGKQATKIEDKKNEKQTKKNDDPHALPDTSKKRGRTNSQSTTSNKPVVKPERRRGGGTRDQPDVGDGIKNLAKKQKISTVTGVKNSSASTVKKAGRGDQADVKDSINSPLKKRKLSTGAKNSSASTVKKAGRGNKPEVKDSNDSPAKKRKISNRMKSSSADAVKKAERGAQTDVKDSLGSPAKKRKLSNRMKNSSDDAVKKAERGTTKGKKETKMKVKKMEIKVKEEDADMSSDDSHSDWEEVEDTPMNELGEPMLEPSPKKEAKTETMSLEIDIDLPGTSRAGKKKKKEYNWANYFQWQVNKYNKERQLELHKAHLVLLLASSFHSNKICNKMELQCVALSTIPAEILSKKPKQLNINYLSKVLGWFKNCFKIRSDLKEDLMTSLDWILPSMFAKRQAASERQLVHMFAIILRCLGVDVRLIFSLQPLTFKAKKLTKKFKKANEKAPVKKPPSQSPMQEQEKVPLKQSSSSSDLSSPSRPGQSPSKPSSHKSSASAPRKHSTSASIKTTLSKSRQQPTKPSSSRLSASAPKTQSTSSNMKMSSSKAAHPPSKSLPNSSSSATAKTHSTSSDTKTDPLKSGQRRSKAPSSKSSASAPKTQTTSPYPKTTSSKAVQGKGKAPSGQAIKEQKTAPDKKPGSKMRLDMSRSTGKVGGEKQRLPSGGGHTPKRAVRVKNNTRRAMASKMNHNYDEDNDEEDESGDDDHSDYEEELRKSASKRKARAPFIKGSSKKRAKMASSVSSIEEVSSDSDFEERVMSVTKQPRKTEPKKGGIKKKASRKVLSSDSDECVMLVDILDPGSDCWLEVYLSSEKRWMCVDCVRTLINKPEMCEKKATQPITYVIGVENDGCVKDVTRRYASKWMTETHKIRPVDEWWAETLKPYESYKDRDMKEDSDVQSNLTNKPLPTSVGEYKNHPLYALKRHLLKFEALYPESAAIMGYCKGEPVYSRECVHSLHTKETWMKEGKAIRIGEKPYKMVKPRPKWKKGLGMIKTEEAILGIYGAWQVEDYIPPPAVDGKVPRNEYGNVELFKPTMLPAGTVHLKLPGLNRVARKLNIDCAPAMTGWDFHSGFNHPVMDGFVVCDEHVDVLVAAWEEDRAEHEKKEKEKREARAMNHWKLFIKSLLIKERLKHRYGENNPNFDAPGTSQQSEKDGRKDSSPVKASWPENKMTAFTGDEGNLLPFEKKSKKKKKR